MTTSSRITHRKSFERVDGILQTARFVYCLDGIPDGIGDDQILAIGRSPNDFGNDSRNKVPAADAIYEGLTSPRFSIHVSNRRSGRVMVEVSWGRRFVNIGPLTDVDGLTGGSLQTNITIPYTSTSIADIEGVPVGVVEIRDEPFVRGASIKRYRRILPAEILPSEAVDAFTANFRKLYPDRGILHDVEIREINQSQSYIYTDFINYSSIRGFAANEIEPGTLAVEALPINGEYKRPDPNGVAGATQVRQPSAIYETGSTLPWLP
tara:strand:+ start:378008 stop:378802 length:795 start_codon:yes stop_codon:yes gene_type:complete